MKALTFQLARILSQLSRDEHGGEVIEYALILGIVIVVTVGAVGGFGSKVTARWTSLNASF